LKLQEVSATEIDINPLPKQLHMKFPKFKQLAALVLFLTLGNHVFSQVTVLSGTGDGGFETGATFVSNNWIAVNTLQTNQWWCGTAVAGQTGVRCAYVGTTAANNNYTATAASVVHLYRVVTIPAGLSQLTLNFRFKVRGRSNEDYMEVSMIPTSMTPVAGALLNTGMIETNYKNETAWVDEILDIPCEYAGTTQRLVFTWVNDNATGSNPAIAIDNVSIVGLAISSCDVGLGDITVASLPYNSGPGTTCNFDDDINSVDATVCNDPAFMDGEDVVWNFTPTTSGQITIDLNAPNAFATSLSLYDGCPTGGCTGIFGNCVANVEDFNGSKSMCVSVVSGTTYYLVLDDGNSDCNDYDNLFISSANAVSVGATCANPVTIASLPYSVINESTACMGDDYNASTPGACSTVYNSGEDKVYAYTSGGNECISLTINNGTTDLMGFQIYLGCPGIGTCIATDGGLMLMITDVTLSVAGTYYIVIDSWAPPSAVSYDLAITSYGSGAVNDLPCNAINLPIATFVFGDNNCSGGTGEQAAPLCWTSPGSINSVWFKATVPASGVLAIQTQLISLADNQIEVFSGACNSLTPIAGGCNDNPVSGFDVAAELQLNALTPGSVVYIRVDGVDNLTGTFNIMASDSIAQAGFNNQDCLGAIPVCGNQVIHQATSFFGDGLISEIPLPGTLTNPSTNPDGLNSGCLLAGELNIVWYSIHINSPGLLSWTHTHPMGFYDWIMFDITNSSCSAIFNDALPPVRCNWNGAGSNMCGMQNPLPAGGSQFNFQDPLPVVAGQTIVLALSNYSYTNGGYTLDFSNSTAGIGNAPTINWTGATNTAWASSTNWAGCNTPACGVTANIFPTAVQPVISANTTVQSINVLGGATLTVNPGVTVTVCGDFNNFGTINVAPTSTILMNNGAIAQTFDGALTGNNKLGNVTITKSGIASTAVDIDIAGNFTTSNTGSVFNTNNRYIKLGGNFTNASGDVTFINVVPGGTLEFNGTTTQNYSPGGLLTLENVVMNHTGTGVNLSGNDMLIGLTGTLDLTSGKIITTPAYEVTLQNTSPFAVFNHNATSFVQGYLRRFLTGAADSYDFPVGHATKGYQNANVTFTSNTLIPDLLANFETYALLPAGPFSNDCGGYDYSLSTVLDNGFWNINASLNSNNGNYDLTLNNTNFSATSNFTTVVTSPLTPPTSLSWTLDGICDATSTASTTIRRGMNGFGTFGTGQAIPIVLPIELLSFSGENKNNENLLYWTTATEFNNSYFTLEHSSDGRNFSGIEIIPGSGNSTFAISYEAIDHHPYKISYYRLKQTDFDGRSSYSQTIVLSNKSNSTVLEFYPNPVSNILNLFIGGNYEEPVQIRILDPTGRILYSEKRNLNKDDFSIQINTSDFSTGSYFLQVYNLKDELIGNGVFIK